MIGHIIRLVGPEQRAFAKRQIDDAPDRSMVEIKPERRSNPQNDKMWAMIGDVMRAKPEGREYTKEIWKALFMAEAGFKPLFEPSLDGQGVIPIGYKSSQLAKAEFHDLIEAIYAYGSEHGVKWTEPVREDDFNVSRIADEERLNEPSGGVPAGQKGE